MFYLHVRQVLSTCILGVHTILRHFKIRTRRCLQQCCSPSLICKSAHVLYTLFVFFGYCGLQHILCCVLVLFVFVLCALCCQFLWIVHFWLPLRYSLTFICQFLWIVHFWLPLRCSLTFICQFLWIVHFWLPLRYSLTFNCQFLWIVHFWLPLRCSLTFIWGLALHLHV
jgi:hypothetical protein